jgi:flagellar FliL protein
MAKEKEEEVKDEEAKGGKKKLIIIVLPVVVLLAAAGWFFFLKPDKSGVAEPLPEPVPGLVVKLDPITINLAGGAAFLKFGMAIQPTASAVEVDGSKALDLAIGEFSQLTIDELSSPDGRLKAKEELIARIKLTYLPEGTDLATVTSPVGTIEATQKEAVKAKADADKAKKPIENEEIHIEKLSGAEVIKLAKSLTVQPDVYDLYFTEFVMQ